MQEPNDSRRNSTASVEALKASAPAILKVLAGANSTAPTVILALIGLLYSEFRTEWASLKTDVSVIRQEVGKMPTAEEYERLFSRVESLTERVIVLESRCCAEEYPVSSPLPPLHPDLYKTPHRGLRRP
jgi:hypothetical protein